MTRTLSIAFTLLCGLSAQAQSQDLHSQVSGLEIVALTDLPPAPSNQGDREFCSHKLVAEPQTAAGALVAAKGWAVTAEQPFGTLTAVSFVAGFIQGTSGSCELRDGNLGLYAGDQPVALVYASDAEHILIGFASAFGQNGLRLWSGDYMSSPLADLQQTGDSITILPLAATESVCNGTADVPLIYGLPIDQARALLAKAGWQPVPHSGERESPYGQADDIAAAGVTEVEECSGTGFGFCSYMYQGPAGRLSVTTIGEIGEDGSLPTVSDYGVDCG